MEKKDSNEEVTDEVMIEEVVAETIENNSTPNATETNDMPMTENKATYSNEPVTVLPQKPSKKGWWKSKRFIIPTLLALLLFLDNSENSKNARELQIQNEKLSAEYDAQTDELEIAKDDLKKKTTEYKNYQTKMKPYEEMEVAEAEANRIKAEKVAADKKAAEDKAIADKKAAEDKAAADAAAAKAAEEARGYETGISYDQLARTPGDFKGQKVKFYGKVVQVMEGTGVVQIRLAVDDNYDAILLGEYLPSIVASRILDDDYITIYGTSTGTISYQSTMGGTITIPGISIDKIEM